MAKIEKKSKSNMKTVVLRVRKPTVQESTPNYFQKNNPMGSLSVGISKN